MTCFYIARSPKERLEENDKIEKRRQSLIPQSIMENVSTGRRGSLGVAAFSNLAGKKEAKQRSLCNLEVKPWEEEQDLMELFNKIKTTVKREGLQWGENCALKPVAYGIKKICIKLRYLADVFNHLAPQKVGFVVDFVTDGLSQLPSTLDPTISITPLRQPVDVDFVWHAKAACLVVGC